MTKILGALPQDGLIKSESQLRDLLAVPHKGRILTVAHPVFEFSSYPNNLRKMQKQYSHPITGERISFREPTTSESISALVHEIKRGNTEIFCLTWFQLGRIVKNLKGIFANVPKDVQGNPITDETALESLLKNTKDFDGIRLEENDFAFAPYETFEQGELDEKFTKMGLARALEHTEGKTAENLNYLFNLPVSFDDGRRICIRGFDKVKEPVIGVVNIMSTLNRVYPPKLYIYCEDNTVGQAFGVLEQREKYPDTPKNHQLALKENQAQSR